ncbi:MAG: nitroreductase family protein [Acidobacteria bacterium]|nr:nitroreductase family protein [Acidobacteriota bacterium]
MSGMDAYSGLLELVKKRRTHRRFLPDPVPDEAITKIVDVARWAPSGFHTQSWEFVVVRKKDVKDKIVAVLEKYGPPIKNPAGETSGGSFRDAPVFIILFCDWRARAGLPAGARERDDLVANIFCSSMAGAFLYMHLAAASLGLASQWYSAAGGPDSEREIKKILGVPGPLKIYDMMALGYAAQPPAPKEVRSLEEMIHYDDCGLKDFRNDGEVAVYAEKTHA